MRGVGKAVPSQRISEMSRDGRLRTAPLPSPRKRGEADKKGIEGAETGSDRDEERGATRFRVTPQVADLPSVDPLGLFLEGGVPTIPLRFTRNLDRSSVHRRPARGGALDSAGVFELTQRIPKSLSTYSKLLA